MGGHRCCRKQKVKKGLWSPEEDDKLLKHITTHGHSSWSSVPKHAGLQRCGKSCRLRWMNYLRPDLRRGCFTEEEEQIIIDVHRILGNKWAQIAKHLPGRTDNEVKNYWNSCIKKKLMLQGLDPKTHNLIPSHKTASNKITCNIQQTYHQIPSNVSMEIRPHRVLTLPAPSQSPLMLQPIAIPMPPASAYQNLNFVWNEYSTNFPCVSSIDHYSGPISSSSSSSLNPPADVSYCMWGTNTNIGQPTESPSLAAKQQQVQNEQREMDKICDHLMAEDMDCSFDGSSFEHLEFVDFTLMSGAMCHDFSSIFMDDFAWNF